RAAIVYEPFEMAHLIPEPYRRYDALLARVEDIPPGSTVVLPEVYSRHLERFADCRIMFWWMSVNNFHKAVASTGASAGAEIEALQRHAGIHLYQSEYARGFLASADLAPAARLSDKLADDYIAAIGTPPTAGRRDLIAFNPAKGYARTEQIFYALTKSLRQAPQVVELKDRSREEIRRVLSEAKVYIDFGEHPGKDRLPREAAALGACVLTNRRGAAGNAVDLPIPEDCKIDDRKPKWERRAANKIHELLGDYTNQAPRFDEYRRQIAGEPHQFAADVAALFPVRVSA
uniref:hypothetical protein n=1 Tax=Mycobacterium sp. TaxID=1785 RepID=UPI003F9645E5